jgi:glucokinase
VKKGGKYYVGVDVGGTKIVAALVKPSGTVVARNRTSTPRETSTEGVVRAILDVIDQLLSDNKVKRKNVRGIGVGIPGVLDPDEGRVVMTPNMNLSGVDMGSRLKDHFRIPAVIGNDVNLGTLGEKWLGAARFAPSVVGIFVGTGIGGGVILDGKLLRGAREAAGEIGHLVMQVGGPVCGCGNRGCLEALASRTAIERDIRAAVDAGKKTILTELVGKDLKVIRSRMLLRAVQERDPLVLKVLRDAARTLGYACLTVRHLLDPEVIVLGGGVMEACGDYMLPFIRETVASDALPGARPGGRVVRSALGDDAVVLGAVALAQEAAGRTPWKDEAADLPEYPALVAGGPKRVCVGNEEHKTDFFVRADGKVKDRDLKLIKEAYGTTDEIGPEELAKVCQEQPDYLLIGTGPKGEADVTAEGKKWLRTEGIAYESLPTPMAVQQYNRARGRKAALVIVAG